MPSNTRITSEKVGKVAAKVATEAAYALTGLVDIVSGTVQDVVKQGRQSFTERRTATGGSPVKDYAGQVPGQLKDFVGELKDAYAGLSARGRRVLSDGFSTTAHRTDAEPPAGSETFEQPPTS
ncbi:MAG: hypothetical protein QM582_18060 [Micropruina sp.]|uniref:hypothetical protein n=1 Tax=Micropruina sp. TaxID=2737536 RepID=UPI0039E3E2FE